MPKSIFEIPGAKDIAIEVNSFSKYTGFTRVRLGWTIIPSELKFSDGSLVKNDFNRVMTTTFNGASNIVQARGLACIDKEEQNEISALIDYYLENSAMLKEAMESIGYKVFGGDNAPYVLYDYQRKNRRGIYSVTSWRRFGLLLFLELGSVQVEKDTYI